MNYVINCSTLCLCLVVISGFGGFGQPPAFVKPVPANNTPEAEARGAETCNLPSRWEGNWFQSGVHQTITISRHGISTKGRCLEADGEKYLVFNDKEKCYRCVVFHEKHQNVLQYKETFCIHERRILKNFCGTITGDANLFSLFRMDPVPIECPFKAPYTFTYNRGTGECLNPVSTIDACTQPSRLMLNYQACPDIAGTESSGEELQCLATWKEGSARYLLGLMQYRHYASLEERYRCFVYERTKRGGGTYLPVNASVANDNNVMYRIAQSGDATCNGLTLLEGSRTMTLRKAPIPKPCQFPSWLQSHAQWHTLDLKSTYVFEASVLRVSNTSDLNGFTANTLLMSASCSQILENPTLDKVMLILQSTRDCQSGFVCTAIFKRDGHIVEMQMGNVARMSEDACHVSHFNQTSLPYVTLVSSTPETRQCPYLGRFQITGLAKDGRIIRPSCTSGFNSLQVGCNQLDTLQLKSECLRTDVLAEYSCHGWWEEMGISYLITTPLSRASKSASRYCFVFRESTSEIPREFQKLKRKRIKGQESSFFSLLSDAVKETEDDSEEDEDDGSYGRILQFSSIADSCRRDVVPGIDGSMAFNVSSQGQCNDVNSSPIPSSSHLVHVLVAVWVLKVMLLQNT